MNCRYILFLVISLLSFDTVAQCLSSTDILVRTSNSCSYFDNGILIFKNLKAKTPYRIQVNDRVYRYTANDYGTLNIYSLAPGTYENLIINDRVNACPEINITGPVTIDSWNNKIEGPTTGCQGETVLLNSSSTSTWTINSSIINFNATETRLPLGEQKNVRVIAKALIEGCYERDTLDIRVDDAPQVNLLANDKSYCYNKQNELIGLQVSQGELTEVLFNGELITTYDSTMLQLNIGDSADENTLLITAENGSKCISNTTIPLTFTGEAPADDVGIIWWPGNIFSIKNDNPQLSYRWGWINSIGELSYANSQAVSADGKHYFAGNQSVEVNDLMQKRESSSYLLFVEYRYAEEECFNRLLFNSNEIPNIRNQSQQVESGFRLQSYPNPFVESISVSSSGISGFENLLLNVIDASGKLYVQKNVDISNGFLLNLPTSEFPKGIYFIQLSHQGFTLLSNKVIKQ